MEKVAEELTPGRGEGVNENILNKVDQSMKFVLISQLKGGV